MDLENLCPRLFTVVTVRFPSRIWPSFRVILLLLTPNLILTISRQPALGKKTEENACRLQFPVGQFRLFPADFCSDTSTTLVLVGLSTGAPFPGWFPGMKRSRIALKRYFLSLLVSLDTLTVLVSVLNGEALFPLLAGFVGPFDRCSSMRSPAGFVWFDCSCPLWPRSLFHLPISFCKWSQQLVRRFRGLARGSITEVLSTCNLVESAAVQWTSIPPYWTAGGPGRLCSGTWRQQATGKAWWLTTVKNGGHEWSTCRLFERDAKILWD